MRILILRHAKTDEEIMASWAPQPLLPEGFDHAKKILNTFLKKYPELKIKRIVSSDILRCAQIAEIMAKELNVPLVLDEGFRSFNIGSGAGVTHSEFYKAHPGQFVKHLPWDERIDDGESPHLFYSRVKQAFQNLIDHTAPKEDLILVTHRSVLDIIYTLVLNVQWSNQLYYYKMEYLLVDIKKKKTRKRNSEEQNVRK